MTALYQLTSQYLALAETLAGLDLDAATVADTIEASGLVDSFQDKAQGIEYVARAATAHNAAIDAEIERLQALKASREKVASGLRKYLLDNMERSGIARLDCPFFSLSIRKNPPAVEITDSTSLPAIYWKFPEPKPLVAFPDKAAIKEALKAGVAVVGAQLVQNTRLVVT